MEVASSLPVEFSLHQNYPNPFNPTTTIQFALPQGAPVTLKVFDITGREVATLIDGELQSGNHRIEFDGSRLASGVYVYQIRTEGFVQAKRLTLMK